MPSERAHRRILHTSDIHLDRPGDAASICLEKLVDLAIEHEVDLVVIAGDLFDHNRIGEIVYSTTLGQLRRLSVPVIILPGNHDCLIPEAILRRPEFQDDGIHVIDSPDGEMLDMPEQGFSFWGRSLTSYEADIRPLDGLPAAPRDGRWNIVLAHGFHANGSLSHYRSLVISDEDIAASAEWDYVAMGHIPVFRCVSAARPVAYYSGAASVVGTAVLVDFDDETGTQVTTVSCRAQE
jgi:DNA repair exonuclease SbcCD nuclease subunit